ncbi:hypothetical protein [Rhodococcus sp. ACS1]|uniref:hypothetical protein n=1 Tax=Rhodococcus sp. ACS1 TaxID=2028570 RepID=UPI00211CB5DF|nr:hypothetical protein [Rhodococcus sp. ACS1]
MSLISTPLILALAYWVVSRSLEEVGGFSGLVSVEPTTTMTVTRCWQCDHTGTRNHSMKDEHVAQPKRNPVTE